MHNRNFAGKTLFWDQKDMILWLFFLIVHFKMVLSVSFNRTIINLFEMPNDIHLCSYAEFVIENWTSQISNAIIREDM